MKKDYPLKAWLSPKIEIKDSKNKGRGIFAKSEILEGEVVVKFGGVPLTTDEIRNNRANPHSYVAVSEDLFLGVLIGQPEQGDEYLNHSCDPNLWMTDEVTLVARRAIRNDEELTADYAMWEWDESWKVPWKCACGASNCRGVITGLDYKSLRLDEKYNGNIAPFLKNRLLVK